MYHEREQFSETGDLHPIDLVETVAEGHDWSFERIDDDQIAMVVEGRWRSYSVTLAWSDSDETLRLICCFEMDPPEASRDRLWELLNMVNDQCWAGGFTFWPEEGLMVYRYGLVLAGGARAEVAQVNQMVAEAVLAGERFYPAFQLCCWGDRPAKEAIEVAIAEAYGHA